MCLNNIGDEVGWHPFFIKTEQNLLGRCFHLGTYRRAGGNLLCQPCPSGYIREHYGGEDCEQCPEKHYCPNPTTKRQCPADANCPAGSVAPIYCQNMFQYDPVDKVHLCHH